MGINLGLSVLPIGPDGEIILEFVTEPRYSIHDSYVWELFNPRENPRFALAVQGLEFTWYTHTTMEKCLAESRNPRRSDCYDPGLMLTELTTVRDRLQRFAAELPRHYTIRKSSDLSQELTGTRFFYAGRLFNAGADWDVCRASWSADRGSLLNTVRHMVYEYPDIEFDFRTRTTFACNDCVFVRDDPGTPQPSEGPPITLHISSVSAYDFFREPLTGMIGFAERAKAGGFVVFTSRS